MKKLFLMMTAAMAMLFTGCKTLPTTETVNNVSYTLGASTALVIKMMKLDADTMSSVNMVIASLKNVVPSQEETFEEVWTPVADELIAKLVAEGKLDDQKAKLVSKAVNAIAKGLDRLFEKHAEWRKYGDLVRTALDGFMRGYEVVMKFKNSAAAENADRAETELICERACVEFDPTVR